MAEIASSVKIKAKGDISRIFELLMNKTKKAIVVFSNGKEKSAG